MGVGKAARPDHAGHIGQAELGRRVVAARHDELLCGERIRGRESYAGI
jgi:hypothetical protein